MRTGDRRAQPARGRAGALLVAFLAALLGLASCAERAPRSAAQAAYPTETPLPEFPPPWVLEPDLYDENGCQKLDDGEVDCGAQVPPEFDIESDPSDPTEWRALPGFTGPYYVGTLEAGDVVLLPESVTTSTEGSWRAWGLVRNETTEPAGADVTASLHASDGTMLQEVQAHVLVDPLRPGEPGPFVLESKVPSSDVADVKWAVEATAPGPLTVRDFQIMGAVWSLPYGNWPPDSPLVPWGESPHPYVSHGGVDNLFGATVRQPLVVAAWVDRDFRVVWVETALVGEVPHDPESSKSDPDDVTPRSFGDFYLLVSDPGIGPHLSDDIGPNPSDTTLDGPMYWAAGST